MTRDQIEDIFFESEEFINGESDGRDTRWSYNDVISFAMKAIEESKRLDMSN